MRERLRLIAEEIVKGESMADIGTDHGFLPISLLNEGKCKRAIATDISSAAVKKTEEYAAGALLMGELDVRCGSGLETLMPGEVDVVVIAGMGGVLIAQILGNAPQKTVSFNRFILQPRKGIGKLRTWLVNNGFIVDNVVIMKEGPHFCEIMTVLPPEGIGDFGERIVTGQPITGGGITYDFPIAFADNSSPIMREYIQRNLCKEQLLFDNLKFASSVSPERIDTARFRVEYMNNLLHMWMEKHGV